MDSKIILAILIVALIGIVAATYQNETGNVINTLTSVDTEDAASDSVSDIEDAGVDNSNSQNNLRIDEDVVKPDTSTVSKNPTTNHKQSNIKNSISSNNNNQASNNQPNNNQQSNNQQNNNQQSNTPNTPNQDNSQISKEKAVDIASKNLPSQFSNAKVAQATLNDDYYLVSFTENNEIIGEYEISAKTGKITGGAFKNEVPNPSDVVQQTQNNSEN